MANPNGGTLSKWLDVSDIYPNGGDGSEIDQAGEEKIQKAHNYVIFNIADEIKIASGKEEVFEVRTESGELLPTGSKITLFVDKARTYTDKASLDGYKICLDNDDDVNLGTVEVKAKN